MAVLSLLAMDLHHHAESSQAGGRVHNANLHFLESVLRAYCHVVTPLAYVHDDARIIRRLVWMERARVHDPASKLANPVCVCARAQGRAVSKDEWMMTGSQSISLALTCTATAHTFQASRAWGFAS